MRIWHVLLVALAAAAGCTRHEVSFTPPDQDRMFDAGRMRVHPIFSQIKDWTGDDLPDGVEAVVEFSDQFGDPTKASGQILFELYEFRANSPDVRGKRIVNPWVGSLANPDEQKAHWSRPARSYTFQLACPDVSKSRTYVLTATFERDGGGRFFGQTIIQAERPRPATPTTPTTRPAAAATQDAAG